MEIFLKYFRCHKGATEILSYSLLFKKNYPLYESYITVNKKNRHFDLCRSIKSLPNVMRLVTSFAAC